MAGGRRGARGPGLAGPGCEVGVGSGLWVEVGESVSGPGCGPVSVPGPGV